LGRRPIYLKLVLAFVAFLYQNLEDTRKYKIR
jgi:hypothetical protein